MTADALAFQRFWTEKMMSVSHAGLTLGMTIVQKMRSSFAPSIFADSISDMGSPSMNCFIRNSPIGAANAGRMTAQCVSTRFRRVMVR